MITVRILVFALLACSAAALFADEGMQYPLAVAADKQGTIFIADRNLPGVWKFAGGKLAVYFQGSKKFRTPLNAVRCLTIDKDGKLLAGDSSTREVYRFDDSAQPQPLTKGNIGIPMCLAVAEDGSIFASDLEIQRIVKIPAAGGEPQVMAPMPAVRGMVLDNEGRLWVAREDKGLVERFSADFKQHDEIAAGFQFPHHLTFGGDGKLYLADGYAKTIWKITPGEKPVPLVKGDPLKNPVGLTWSEPHGLLVADPHQKAVYRVTLSGEITKLVPP